MNINLLQNLASALGCAVGPWHHAQDDVYGFVASKVVDGKYIEISVKEECMYYDGAWRSRRDLFESWLVSSDVPQNVRRFRSESDMIKYIVRLFG